MKPETKAQQVASDWADTTFGEVAEYITSGSRDWSKYYSGHGAMFIRTQDINTNRLRLDDVARVALPEKVEGKRTRVFKGDVLITITGANVGKVALVEIDLEEAYVSQSVALVRLKDKRLGKFLHYQLMTKYRGDKTHLESMAYGLGRPVLNLDNIRDVPIRLVPLDQQERIVAEIEKQFSRLDEAVANLKRVKANLKRYKAAVLKAAVEGKLTEDWRKAHPDVEPATELLKRILAERRAKWNGKGNYKEPDTPNIGNLPNLPNGWMWALTQQLGEIQLGRQRSPKNRSKNYPTKYIRAANITEAGLDLSDVLEMEFTPEERGRYRLQRDDILLSEASGSPRQVGKPAVWRDELPGCCFQNTVIRLRPRGALPEYLLTVFKQFYVNGFFAQVAGGVGINHLSADKFSMIPVPLPPLAEQERIVTEVEQRLSVIDASGAMVSADLIRTDRLRQAVLALAFSGRLVNKATAASDRVALLQENER
jgi:type I restriction enzyme, S subunit